MSTWKKTSVHDLEIEILKSTSKTLFPHDKCPYPSEVQQKACKPGLLDCEYTSTFSATMNDE